MKVTLLIVLLYPLHNNEFILPKIELNRHAHTAQFHSSVNVCIVTELSTYLLSYLISCIQFRLVYIYSQLCPLSERSL